MDPRRLVFVDETGLNTKMIRLYGRSPRGQRCYDQAPYGHWCTSTFIAGLRHNRISAPMLLDGPINGDLFVAWLEQCLGPTLKENDIVICDNLPAHKVHGAQQAVQSYGASLVYLPAYSPDLNPIEMTFSKLKTFMRRCACRSFDELITATAEALDTFTAKHCQGYFTHAQYAASFI